MLRALTPESLAEIQSGDLVWYRCTGLLPWLIRWRLKSDWSHVGIAWRVDGELLLIEADVSTDSVRVRPLLPCTTAKWAPTGVDWERVRRPILRTLGADYAETDALRAGWGRRMAANGWQCAELAAYMLALDGRTGLPESPNPKNTAELFQ